jgi:hypothetical protein
MADRQLFELDGVPFGAWPGVVVKQFTPGEAAVESGDTPHPTRPGVLAGKDVLRAATWTWELITSATDEVTARALLAPLAGAWQAAQELDPFEQQVLRYRVAGRWRRVYGRARRWAPPKPGPTTRSGRADVTAEFAVLDPLHYDDVEQAVSLTSIPPTVGGFVAPIVAPLTTAKNSETAADTITVGGDTTTPLRVTFYGPNTDPWMTVAGVRVALTGRIAAGRRVTVDARAGTVLDQNGDSVGGMLSRTARMGQLRVPPGTHAVRYGGSDSARATVAWRNAWRTL